VQKFPRTDEEFEREFSTEEACAKYFARLRWPNDWRCPHCGGEGISIRRRNYRCNYKPCSRESSVKTNTRLEKSKVSLKDWFRAAWFVTSRFHGTTASDLQDVLCLSKSPTARKMALKFKGAMFGLGDSKLSGHVVVGCEPFHGYSSTKVDIIVIAEVFGDSIEVLGRIVLQSLTNTNEKKQVIELIKNNIEKDSFVSTPEYFGNLNFSAEDTLEDYRLYCPSSAPEKYSESFLGDSGIGEWVRHWLSRSSRKLPTPEFLDYYLNEFVFKYNHEAPYATGLPYAGWRRRLSHGKLFYELLKRLISRDKTVPNDLNG